MNIKLISQFSLSNFGGSELFIKDINNDGIAEFVWLQSSGTLSSNIYRTCNPKYKFLNEYDKDIFCLTITDIKGEILWQKGRPWGKEIPFPSHGSTSLVDFIKNFDNTFNIVCKTKSNELSIIEGKTGNIIKNRMICFFGNVLLNLTKVKRQ